MQSARYGFKVVVPNERELKLMDFVSRAIANIVGGCVDFHPGKDCLFHMFQFGKLEYKIKILEDQII